MPPPVDFNGLLRQHIKVLRARAMPGYAHDPPWADNPYPLQFDDDIAHLRRWLDSGEANKIWRKLTKNASFNYLDAQDFLLHVLSIRHAAETGDKFSKEMPGGARRRGQLALKVRKRWIKELEKGQITPQQYAEANARIEEILHRPKPQYDPLLTSRSSRQNSRPRTIFMRVLSESVHDLFDGYYDDEVAALAGFAFGCVNVTGDMARSARRPSTRKKRRHIGGGVLVNKN